MGYISEELWGRIKTRTLHEAREVLVNRKRDDTVIKAAIDEYCKEAVSADTDDVAAAYDVVVRTGDPVEAIVEESTAGDYDLIVVAHKRPQGSAGSPDGKHDPAPALLLDQTGPRGSATRRRRITKPDRYLSTSTREAGRSTLHPVRVFAVCHEWHLLMKKCRHSGRNEVETRNAVCVDSTHSDSRLRGNDGVSYHLRLCM